MPGRSASVARDALIALALMAAVLACYHAVRGHALVNYDDETYLLEQPQVRAGLTAENVRWAFTTRAVANWHPLTWISYMLDVEMYGFDDLGAFHMTSVILHAINSALLFGLLRFMTGSAWRSAMVAALFALHPQHVESVAWLSERKDVLCALFAFLSLWAYAWFARRPRVDRYVLVVVLFALGRYVLVVALFALGLMSKPMLVTLPLVMLLLDFWPLNRVKTKGDGRIDWKCVSLLALEKVPLLAASAWVCMMTIAAQRDSGAIQNFQNLPLDVRMANAVVSYVMYIAQMFWPTGLVPVYDHPLTVHVGRTLAAGAFLAMVSALCIWQARKRPHLLVGWLWYLGMLVPVIGLVQVGGQARADRYTYLPMIGVYIMIAWLIPPMTAGARSTVQIALRGVPAVIVLSLLAILTIRQVAVWQHSATLWEHTIATTGGTALVFSNRGDVNRRAGRIKEAEADFRHSIRLNPNYADGHYNLGIVLGDQRRTEEALAAYTEAVRLKPNLARAHYNVGNIFNGLGRKQEAVVAFEMAIKFQPRYPQALNNLGNVLYDLQRFPEAEAKYRAAIAQDPNLVFAHQGLAHALFMQQRYDEARAQVNVVLRLKPDHPQALRLKETLDAMP